MYWMWGVKEKDNDLKDQRGQQPTFLLTVAFLTSSQFLTWWKPAGDICWMKSCCAFTALGNTREEDSEVNGMNSVWTQGIWDGARVYISGRRIWLLSPANFLIVNQAGWHSDYLKNLKFKNNFALSMNIHWKYSFSQIISLVLEIESWGIFTALEEFSDSTSHAIMFWIALHSMTPKRK